MTNRARWQHGDTSAVLAAVDSETVIEIGDLVYQDIDDAKPACCAGSRLEFAANFLGVAMQRSQCGDTEPIRVATTGVFEFDCPSGRFELGDLMGVDRGRDINSPAKLCNQAVMPVDSTRLAIGLVQRRKFPLHTCVYVEIRSAVMAGWAQR